MERKNIKNSNSLIHIILTGGTIDSSWNHELDSMEVNTTSDVPEYFHKFPISDNLEFTQVCMKDSRQLTDDDRKQMLQVIEKSTSNTIIIIHGRFTIVDTVAFLSNKLKRNDKVIILTGGTTPLKGFEMSDSPFNVGFAIAKSQDTTSGVYVAMHGKLYSAEQIQKDNQGDVFREMFSKK